MANINISVDQSSDLYTITLDMFEWTALYTSPDGKTWSLVPRYIGPDPNIQFQYTQTSVGNLQFKAVANQNIVIVNSANIMFMKGPSGDNDTYMGVISYTNKDNEIHLLGVLSTFDEPMNDPQPSPIGFSQGRMTGQFQVN